MPTVIRHDSHMAKKKTDNSTDRHKPAKMVRVRIALDKQLEILAERLASDRTEQVNRAIRELLEREGLWPPPPKE